MIDAKTFTAMLILEFFSSSGESLVRADLALPTDLMWCMKTAITVTADAHKNKGVAVVASCSYRRIPRNYEARKRTREDDVNLCGAEVARRFLSPRSVCEAITPR